MFRRKMVAIILCFVAAAFSLPGLAQAPAPAF